MRVACAVDGWCHGDKGIPDCDEQLAERIGVQDVLHLVDVQHHRAAIIAGQHGQVHDGLSQDDVCLGPRARVKIERDTGPDL